MSIFKIDKMGFYLNYFKTLENLHQKNQSNFHYNSRQDKKYLKASQRFVSFPKKLLNGNSFIDFDRFPPKKLYSTYTEFSVVRLLKLKSYIWLNAPPFV